MLTMPDATTWRPGEVQAGSTDNISNHLHASEMLRSRGEVLCVSEEHLQLTLRQTWNDSRSFQELRIWMIGIGTRMIGSSIHFQMAASTVSFAYQDFLLF